MTEKRAHPTAKKSALERWLAAEAAAEEGLAETALAELFTALPEHRPRPGFASRVLEAAGVARPPVVVPWPWPLRAAVGFCLVSAAFAAAWLLPLALLLVPKLLPGSFAELGAAALLAAAEQLPVVFALGEVASTLYDALRLVVTAPPVVGVWLLAVALSTLTLRFLAQLLTPSRSPEHVRVS